MSTELEIVTLAIAEFDQIAAGIGALREKHHGVVYDVATTKGMDEAKAARAEIRAPRYAIEKVRANAKRPILDLGKKLDADAARITSELEALELPVHLQIKMEEDRKESEKQARIAAEQKRVEALQGRLNDIRQHPVAATGKSSAAIASLIEHLDSIPVDDSFQEFQQQAQDAKGAALAALKQMHADRVAHEAEQVRIKAEREELDRLRKAQKAKEEADAKALREKQESDLKEAKRIKCIQDAIADIRKVGALNYTSSGKIEMAIKVVEDIPVDSRFQEFQQNAADAKAATLATLRDAHRSALEAETAAAKAKQEAEEQAAAERAKMQAEPAPAIPFEPLAKPRIRAVPRPPDDLIVEWVMERSRGTEDQVRYWLSQFGNANGVNQVNAMDLQAESHG